MLRVALAYAGALPAAEKKKRPAGKSDELAYIGKTIDKLLVELKANGDRSAKELLKLTQPLIDWRNDLAARMSQRQKPIVLLDVEATVKSKDKAKTHHDAFLNAPSENSASGSKPGVISKGKTPAEVREFWLRQDWEKHDALLARVLGCGRAIVGRWRKRLGKPASHRKTQAAH